MTSEFPMKKNEDKKGFWDSSLVYYTMTFLIVFGILAVIVAIVFTIGGNISQNPDANIHMEESSGSVEAIILRNENVDEFELINPDGEVVDTAQDSGDTMEATTQTGTYEVRAILENGEAEIISSIQIN